METRRVVCKEKHSCHIDKKECGCNETISYRRDLEERECGCSACEDVVSDKGCSENNPRWTPYLNNSSDK